MTKEQYKQSCLKFCLGKRVNECGMDTLMSAFATKKVDIKNGIVVKRKNKILSDESFAFFDYVDKIRKKQDKRYYRNQRLQSSAFGRFIYLLFG